MREIPAHFAKPEFVPFSRFIDEQGIKGFKEQPLGQLSKFGWDLTNKKLFLNLLAPSSPIL
jgi:hypothetical protein